ncbi:kin of IRRE-like protein 1 [Cherax quadricarinatus]|uniref:kin of IRRE-like protein 1 n=1 Tax=Cherax quadricarinatus TaxID=27406 RepID=UPI00387E2F83
MRPRGSALYPLLILKCIYSSNNNNNNTNNNNDSDNEQQRTTTTAINDYDDKNVTLSDLKECGESEHSEPEITWGQPNTHTAYFGDVSPSNVTAVVGHKATLPCRVLHLGNKDVSWIRQRDLHILTLGIFTYTTDNRFKVYHPPDTEQWDLEIIPVTFRDAGVYECQVSTSPKVSLPIVLGVEAVQQARIEGPAEVYIQKGSTIRLTCIVNTHSDNVGAVAWFRDTHSLDYDSPRGGVSVEIEKTPSRTTSKLFLTQAGKIDGGNYTCVPQYADAASVLVHVVNGES